MQDGGWNLIDFRKNVHSIARKQYFAVEIPTLTADTTFLTAIAMSTSLPARTQEALDVFYRGMPMKIDGKATFEPWNVTFLMDEIQTIRNALLVWQDSAYQVSALTNAPHNSYKVDNVNVYQLDLQRETAVKVNFAGMWPTTVGEIELSQEGGIEQCQATFTYDYWGLDKVGSAANGNASAPIAQKLDAFGKLQNVLSKVGSVANAASKISGIFARK
jgi:hypothetical protein